MRDHPFFKELNIISAKLNKIEKLFLKSSDKIANKDIIDNNDFMKLFNISSGTAKNWRDHGKITYSQINNKFYYNMIDVKKMLEANRKPSITI